jgi:hypothetical protein
VKCLEKNVRYVALTRWMELGTGSDDPRFQSHVRGKSHRDYSNLTTIEHDSILGELSRNFGDEGLTTDMLWTMDIKKELGDMYGCKQSEFEIEESESESDSNKRITGTPKSSAEEFDQIETSLLDFLSWTDM